jgi:hypothetical protein
MPIEPLTGYTWPTDGVYLARLNCSLDELSDRLKLRIVDLHDPNGPTRGLGFRTSEDRVYELLEWRHPLDGRVLVSIQVDATVLGAISPPVLIADLITEAGFSRNDFSDVADAAAQVAAAEWATSIAERRFQPPQSHEAEISFDLVMEDDMSFAEGTYRMRGGEWHVFIFSQYDGKRTLSTFDEWDSGCKGRVVKMPKDVKLNREVIKKILGEILYVSDWREVRGPDSMNLR